MENAPRIFVARCVITLEHFFLQRGVLQLLQRAHLESHRRRLRRKPFVFTRERVLAKALLLGRHILRDHLQQSWQCEFLSALLVVDASTVSSRAANNALAAFGSTPERSAR